MSLRRRNELEYGHPEALPGLEPSEPAPAVSISHVILALCTAIGSVLGVVGAVDELKGQQGKAAMVVLGLIVDGVAVLAAFRLARIANRTPRLRERCTRNEYVVLREAIDVFGNYERGFDWLREANPELDQVAPIRVIESEEGRMKVLVLLMATALEQRKQPWWRKLRTTLG